MDRDICLKHIINFQTFGHIKNFVTFVGNVIESYR